MDPRDDYDDAPRPNWRPTLSERDPAPAPRAADRGCPKREGRVPASAIVVAGLGVLGITFVWELAKDAGVNDLDQPWRFVVKAAMALGWFGALATISSWLVRRAGSATRRTKNGCACRDNGSAAEPHGAPDRGGKK